MSEPSLVFRAAGHLCAIGLTDVSEVMRPLPVRALAGAPPFVCGVSVIRGVATPVVSVAALLGDDDRRPGRFVAVRERGRQVALAVAGVLGVRQLPADRLDKTTPLLGTANAALLAALGCLAEPGREAEPLLVLGSARLVPESVWATVGAESPT